MILDLFKLDDRVAVVTGAGRGIGRGIAQAFAEAGAHVVVAARSQDQLEETAAAVRALGRRALPVRCDVLERPDLEALVEAALGEFGRMDVLVNNAGGWPPKAALRTSERDFEAAFRFNVTSAFLLTRFSVPHLAKSDNGSIVNVSSAAGRFAQPGFAAYGTAKAALSFLTRNLAAEFAPKVRVNAIAVGSVETSALASILDGPIREHMEQATPMGRIGSVEDIAACALYLASPAGSWVTGKIFEVDGGIEATNFEMPRAEL